MKCENWGLSVRYKLQDTKIQDMKYPYGNSRSISKLVKKNGQIKKLNFERIHWESSNRYPNEDDQNCSKVRSM